MLPEEILADSLYGSDSNCQTAMQEHQVAVIAPVMAGNQKKFHLAEFTLDAQGKILSCPQGTEPDKVKKSSSGYSAAFPVAVCLECPVFERCPVSKGKKACYYRYTDKDIRLARRRQKEDSPTFREKYRYRAGVEATMSEFDRRTGVKHLRVRGMKAVRFAAIMKAIGLNIFRASRHQGRKNNATGPCRGSLWLFWATWSLFKELVQQRFMKIVVMHQLFKPIGSNQVEMAV
jgi:hypothetical protein